PAVRRIPAKSAGPLLGGSYRSAWRLGSSAADSDPAARAAEIAAILADDGVVAAFAAARPAHDRRLLLAARALEDSHLARGIAALVEDAQHRVAVDDEAREVRHRRGKILLTALARDERHEIAERLGVVEQLPQLHADPRRIDDTHVEREDAGQPVE